MPATSSLRSRPIRTRTGFGVRGAGAVALAGLVAVALSSCAPPVGQASPDSIQPAGLGSPEMGAVAVGCWVLDWDEAGLASQDRVVPDSVQLRSSAMFGVEGRQVTPATQPSGRLADPDDPTAPEPWESRYRINRWWIEGTSVEIQFSDGEEDEWHLSLGLVGEELQGGGEHVSGRVEGSVAVVASKIPCLF